MSKTLVAYNLSKFSSKDINKISARLFQDKIGNSVLPSQNSKLDGPIKYREFGKLQIIFSDYFPLKSAFRIEGDILLNICGYIEKQKDVCEKYGKSSIEDCLLMAYRNGGRKLHEIFSELSGHFTVLIYNKSNNEIIVINDKLGTYPTFVYCKNNIFAYSTEVEALTCIDQIPKVPNFDAIADFLSIGIVQNRKTFIKNINNLSPATILRRKNSKIIKHQKYFSFTYDDEKYKREEYLEEVNNKLTKAIVEAYEINPEQIFSNQTGGFDTRLMNSILVKNKKKPILVFEKDPEVLTGGDFQKLVIKMDGELGEKFAKRYKLEYIAREPDMKTFPKLFYIFMGFMGGEILGGEVNLCQIKKSGENLFSDEMKKRLSRDPSYEFEKQQKTVKSSEAEKRTFVYKMDLYLTSFFNYSHELSNVWNRPRRFTSSRALKIYPFVNIDFLETFLKVPYKEIKNHSFYFALFHKFYKDFCKIDFFHANKLLYKYNSKTNPCINFLGNINKNCRYDK